MEGLRLSITVILVVQVARDRLIFCDAVVRSPVVTVMAGPGSHADVVEVADTGHSILAVLVFFPPLICSVQLRLWRGPLRSGGFTGAWGDFIVTRHIPDDKHRFLWRHAVAFPPCRFLGIDFPARATDSQAVFTRYFFV
jgi:hypothetical protein